LSRDYTVAISKRQCDAASLASPALVFSLHA
jgi:hypothetical protein